MTVSVCPNRCISLYVQVAVKKKHGWRLMILFIFIVHRRTMCLIQGWNFYLQGHGQKLSSTLFAIFKYTKSSSEFLNVLEENYDA